ncbi:glycosyltransferase [Rossellomorea aquimaris]|uniref:glycosyltransferase n=1 Tax=Rossellomorea aquimaris TaxID=189382 RepID=UPI0009EE62F0|nr:glycosyltransferase [Rossellomorea aquimaris]
MSKHTLMLFPEFNESPFKELEGDQSSIDYFSSLLIENSQLIHFLQRNKGHAIPVVLNPLLFSLWTSEKFVKEVQSLIESKLLQSQENEPVNWQLIYSEWTKWDRNLVNAYKELMMEGKAIVIPTTINTFPLTHFRTPRGMEAQIRISTLLYKEFLQMAPKLFWLPQAAYVPGIDLYLLQQGIEYTFISSFSYEQSEKEESFKKLVRSPRGLKLLPVSEATVTSIHTSIHGFKMLRFQKNMELDQLLAQNVSNCSLVEWLEFSSSLSRVGFGYLGMEKQTPILTDTEMKSIRAIHRMEEQLENLYSSITTETNHYVHQLTREWMVSLERRNQEIDKISTHFDQLKNSILEGHIQEHLYLHRKNMVPYPTDEVLEKLFPVKGESSAHDKADSVLILSWEYPPNIVGGLSRHVFDLANNLVKKGKHVHVLTTRSHNALPLENMEGVTVHRVHPLHPYEEDFFKWVFDLNQAFIDYAHSLIKDEKITLIHAHDWIVSTSAIKLKEYYTIPLITTIHATEHGRNQGIYTELQQKIHLEEQLLIQASDHIIVCSEHMKEEVNSLFTVKSPMVVIPNGVELDQLDQMTALYSHENISVPYFFSIGRMVHEKGFETIIRVASSLKARGYMVSFVIAGKGPMLEQYRQLVINERVDDMVEFVGYISDEKRNSYLKNCLAVIFPSLYEPFGIVALEAMAFRKGVVASNIGGLKSIVKHEQTGLLFEPNEEQGLLTQLVSLLEYPDKSSQLGKRGYKMAKSMFSWDRIADQTKHVYEDVLLQAKVEGIKR